MLPTRCTGKFKKISLKGNFRTLGKSFDTKNYPPVLLIPHNNNYAKMNNYEPVLEEKKIDAIPEPYIKEGSPYGNKHNFSEITYRRCLAQNQILNSGWFKVGKVIIIGDSSVGKTGIVNRFSQKVFNSQYKTTIGVDFDVQRFRILNVFYTLQIWDTAGQERFKCIAQSYYRNSQAVIVVFDLNNLKSLSNSKKWLSEALEANSPTKPLIFLVGTKADLVGSIMEEAEAKVGTQHIPQATESLFSTIDVILLAILIGGVSWWLLRKHTKKETLSNGKSYTIQPTSIAMQASNENSFVKKLQSSGRSLVVFYGSQTGTGEEFAGRLAKEGVRYRMKGMVADPEECDMEELVNLKTIPNSLAVFCMATYGEGDPTDNAMEFYEWLQNGDADLTGLNYAVFGLGNKTYEHYNEVAIYVDKRLEELGATRVYDLGLGDDDANIEDDFITWKDKFWPAVCEYFGIECALEDISIRQYRLQEFDDTPERVYTGEMARLHSLKIQRPPFDAKNPYLAKVVVNRELFKGGTRHCMHIEFDIEDSKMRYDSGDHLAVYPVNDTELVEKIGKHCEKNLDTIFTLINTDEDSSKKHPFPCPCSYRTALTHYLDITQNPRTHVLKELAEYCSDPAEKEKLKLMASTSPEGKKLYHDWVIEDNRNIVHILEDMPSCKPALDHLCELLPRLQPRYYSISSSPKLYPTTVHVTAVVVEYDTPTGRHNKGVATTWLAQKVPNECGPTYTVPVFIRKSQFRLPTKPQTPIVMIGPGTGVAPFRGFIQERGYAKKEGKQVGDTVLFYGCRKKAEDCIYQEEFAEYENSGLLTIKTAFSRDQKHKVYVSHLLEQNADHVWRIIGENNGHLYICGDAKSMAVDVRNIILKIMQEKGQMTEEQAHAYFKKMETQKRLCTDVWS